MSIISSLARMWSKQRKDYATYEDRKSSNLVTTTFWAKDFLLIGSTLVTKEEGSRDLESSRLTRAGGSAGDGYSSRGRATRATGGSEGTRLTGGEPWSPRQLLLPSPLFTNFYYSLAAFSWSFGRLLPRCPRSAILDFANTNYSCPRGGTAGLQSRG